MRRVVSVWLTNWQTDRLRRTQSGAPSRDRPLVTVAHDGHRRVVAAVDQAARTLGLYPGLPLAQAQARIPDLTVVDEAPQADADALKALAAWCLRYAPLTSADGVDGLWIDITGGAHLFGGEDALLKDLIERLEWSGIAARAGLADTPGAAHAVARFAPGNGTAIVPVGGIAAALDKLPAAGLRLDPAIVAGLKRLGFERIGQLAATPRGPLARRFGKSLLERLDQAFGTAPETIQPCFPDELVQHRLTFVEPILTPTAFETVIDRLTAEVCEKLEETGRGARQLDLVFERIDSTQQLIRIGTAKPSRQAKALARLLAEKLTTIDPEPGVEAMRLVATIAESFRPAQIDAGILESDASDADISELIDRLTNRLGFGRLYRAEAVESDVPERSVRPAAPLGKKLGTWPVRKNRPSRLLTPPQPVETMALLPDSPPVSFIWQGIRHRIRRADGPERIKGEWWKRGTERDAVRDYFRVEDEEGRRWWLFRQGDGVDPATGGLRWFLHGMF